MIEFPQDGQISIQDLKAFIEAKLGEGAATDQNLKNLFAKMEEHSFQLPNADIDAQGDSQAFIEPHKMSEVYGGRAPITEEGINYGDHEFNIEFFSTLEYYLSINESIPFPFSFLIESSSNTDLVDVRADLTSSHKISVPFGDDGLFLDDENGDTNLGSWVFNNSSHSSTSYLTSPFSFIGNFKVITVNCQFSSSGMHIQFDVEPGEVYYFEAYNSDNSRILIGNYVNDSSYADSSGDMLGNSVVQYTYYAPTQSTIYISIIPQDPSDLSFSIGLIRTYKYFQHGRFRYPELEVEIHNGPSSSFGAHRDIPFPRIDINNIGYDDLAFYNTITKNSSGIKYQSFSSEQLLFDETKITNNENTGGDVYINSQNQVSSTYSGYANMSKKTLLASMQLTNYLGFQAYASHQKFAGEVYVPVVADGTSANDSFANINVRYNKSHAYGIYYDQAQSEWTIVDNKFNQLHSFQGKQAAIDYWQENYNQEGEFYISHDASKIFDWMHVTKGSSNVPLNGILDFIFISAVYPTLYLQWMNYQSAPKSMTGNIYIYSGFSIVQGVGTLFIYELSAGDVIVIGSSNYIVETINSNGLLYITKPANSTVGPVSANYINVNKNAYPKHTAFPQYGYTNTNLKINPFYNLNINTEQLTQIQNAISKVESIIENSMDINMFFIPLADSRSGGTLAAAQPLQQNSIINQIFKSPNYTQVYSRNFGSNSGYYNTVDSLIDATVTEIGSDFIKINSSSSVYAGIARINLGNLIVDEFYKLKVNINADGGQNVMVAVKSSIDNEIYAHRILPAEEFMSVFSFQAKDGYNYLELWVIDHDLQQGRVYVSSGSNIIETTEDLSTELNIADQILVNGQILRISSISSSSITIDSSYPYDVFGGFIYKLDFINDFFKLKSIQVDKINETYVRDQIQSGVVYIDQIDLNSLGANRILADGKSGLYYIILHELLHALGLSKFYWQKYQLSDGVTYHSYPSQYNGVHGTAKYKELIQEKINQLDLSKTLADYYTDSVPAEGGSAHIAEYAKLVNNKVQPSFTNELMSPIYSFDRGILSKITLGFMEDLGYEVDYSQIESSYLLEMSENTDISNDPNSSNYDRIVSMKQGRSCPHCDH